MTTFNLKKHLEKLSASNPQMTKQAEASYEGVQGYFVAQTRSWQNCARLKMLKGASAQEAWQSCLDDYQKANDNIDWIAKNVHENSLDEQKNFRKKAQSVGALQMGSYLEKIKKHRTEGMSTGQAVMAALKECETEAVKLRESAAKGTIKTAKTKTAEKKIFDEKGNLINPKCSKCGKKINPGTSSTKCPDCHEQSLADAERYYDEKGGSVVSHSNNGTVKTAATIMDTPWQELALTGEPTFRNENIRKEVMRRLGTGGFSKEQADQMYQTVSAELEAYRKSRNLPQMSHSLSSGQPIKTACADCGCGHPGDKHEGKCTCGPDCDCKKPGGSCCKKAAAELDLTVEAKEK